MIHEGERKALIMSLLIGHLSRTRHYTRFSAHATSFNLHINPMEYVLPLPAPSTLLQFYK